MTKKSKPVKRKGLIDLKPEEVGVLSLVADYASVPAIKQDLEKVLKESTPRAQKIGRLILRRTGAPQRGRYTLMAKRFLDASANNTKHARVLKSSTPPGLWLER